MDDIVIKLPLNRLLYSSLRRIDLVEEWWHKPNKAFDNNTPDEVYQSGPEGRIKVRDYLYSFAGKYS